MVEQNSRQIIMAARAHCNASEFSIALNLLRETAKPHDPIAEQSQYARLAKIIADQLTELPLLRVAFLSGSTIDHFVDCLRFWMLLEGFRMEAYIAPFDTWRQEASNPDSGLYLFHPDVVWFFLTARDLRFEAASVTDLTEADSLVSLKVQEMTTVVEHVRSLLPVTVIVNNAEAPATRAFGNFEGATTWSHAALLRRYNLHLAAALPSGATVFDLDHQASRFGLDRWEDARLWCHSKHPFSLEANGPVAFSGAKLLAASRGRAHKCVVLDLDNTLWGGVVGDDGVDGIRIGRDSGALGEAFSDFQSYLKVLSQRGVALAVCSKNDPELAKEPFQKRPEMILKLEDFAVFRANWENKADNLRNIAAEMNLGLDALVFVDDNPAERALVRAEIPEITVPDMPIDPSEYIRTLASGAWFETLAFSDEDRNRSKAYRANAIRNAAKSQITDLDTYLRDLEMHATWGTAEAARMTRLAQLVNKTNQFHLTTTRYSEPELVALSFKDDTWVGWFSLRDRFGDHGLIATAVLRIFGETALIDTWTMSCRVFSRGMEHFTFARLWSVARKRGCRWLEGCYRPTAKNGVVATLYDILGGTLIHASDTESRWRFDLTSEVSAGTQFITDDSTNS